MAGKLSGPGEVGSFQGQCLQNGLGISAPKQFAHNRLVGLDLDLSDLEQAAAVARGKLDALAAENDEFRQLVTKLEQAYDQAISQDDEELLRRLIDTVDLEGMSE